MFKKYYFKKELLNNNIDEIEIVLLNEEKN